jgi:hypothetical protein
MATDLVGASVTVLVDVGRGVPFILGVDLLGTPNDADGVACELYPSSDALVDVAADVITMALRWGSSTWFGPLTITEAGTAELVFHDPDRLLDPINRDLSAPVVPGRLMRVDVDGTPAWTGKVAAISHDLAAETSTVQGRDAIPELAAWGVSVDLAAGLVTAQADQLLLTSGWPADRWRVEGTSSVTRKAERYTGNLAEGLRRLADAELGALYVDRTGVVVFRARSETPAADVVAQLGDGGIGIVDLVNTVDRRIINRVVVDMGDTLPARVYQDAPSVAAYGTSSLEQLGSDLNLA